MLKKQHSLGEIPDSLNTKQFIGLAEHLWKFYKEMGWDYFEQTLLQNEGLFERIPDFLSEKFQTSVMVAKKVFDDEIKDPANVLTTFFFPPVLYVRADLQMGGTKLIYGNSTDICFFIINDMTYDLELLINAHMEDGIPVDYWFISKDDEVFERRHMKLGWKLREIPERSKDFTKSGFRVMDILKDVRNERSPQWADSAYSMSMVWAGGTLNMLMEPSNYNTVAELWDGVNAKRIYGMPDMVFGYVPWPPSLGLLLSMGRSEFIIRILGLLTQNNLFINAYEPKQMDFTKEITPEAWEFLIRNMKENGVPTPRQSLGCKPPDLKNTKKFKNEEFDFIYPAGPRIMPYEWGLTEDEAFKGIYTDISHETPSEPVYRKEHIISMGVGLNY